MALTGEIADGVVSELSCFAQVQRVGSVSTGNWRAQVGQKPLKISIVLSWWSARWTAIVKKALDAARKLVTQYLGQQPHIMKASGVSQDLLDEIGQVLTWPATEEQILEAMKLVPDDVVQMITASGTPAEVKAKVREYIASGATCPILYPLGEDVRLMIDTFAGGYAG